MRIFFSSSSPRYSLDNKKKRGEKIKERWRVQHTAKLLQLYCVFFFHSRHHSLRIGAETRGRRRRRCSWDRAETIKRIIKDVQIIFTRLIAAYQSRRSLVCRLDSPSICNHNFVQTHSLSRSQNSALTLTFPSIELDFLLVAIWFPQRKCSSLTARSIFLHARTLTLNILLCPPAQVARNMIELLTLHFSATAGLRDDHGNTFLHFFAMMKKNYWENFSLDLQCDEKEQKKKELRRGVEFREFHGACLAWPCVSAFKVQTFADFHDLHTR